MVRIVKRDGLTVEIKPIPSGKLRIGKRPAGGILECECCGRREANTERDENAWELWYLQQRYSDLCPACVPVVTRMCGESRRIPNPQFLTADELFGGPAAQV